MLTVGILSCTAVCAGSASATMLTVTLDGAGAGTVTSSPPGIACSNTSGTTSGDCSFDFPLASMVTLTVEADPSSVFADWAGTAGGTCTGNANPCTTGMLLLAPLTATAMLSPKPSPPRATTGAASEIVFPSAKLTGTVNPNTSDFAVRDCQFEYGTTTRYGQSVPCTPSSVGTGTSPVDVIAHTGLLEPQTTYHYRLVATNVGGTDRGADRTLTTAAAPGDACPNAAVRAQQGVNALVLPDCMALEMVSPPNKGGGSVRNPWISADGSRVVFNSRFALADTPELIDTLAGDLYVASRGPGASGWTTAATTPPAAFDFGAHEFGNADAFTPDFGRWVSRQAESGQFGLGQMTLYEQSLAGEFVARSGLLAPLTAGDRPESTVAYANAIQAVTPDLSHLFVRPGQSTTGTGTLPVYFADDPQPSYGTLAVANAYVFARDALGEPSVDLLARDAANKEWGGTCGAWVGGSGGGRNQGAVSPDGRRVYFSTRPTQAQPDFEHGRPDLPVCASSDNPIRILRRQETDGGVRISELLPGGTAPTQGSDFFEGASADGAKVYFTTSRSLVASDTDGGSGDCSPSAAVAGCDLYLYDSSKPPAERLTQVSAGEATTGHTTPGVGARVLQGTTAISGDGTRAYFVAEAALTGTNREGRSPSTLPGARNLYVYDSASGRLDFVGTLDSGDAGQLFGASRSFVGTARAVPMLSTDADPEHDEVGGDGHVLVFQSRAGLTDNDGDGDGLDLYRYDAVTGALSCVSCAPDTSVDSGTFDVTPGPGQGLAGADGTPLSDVAERSRWVSEDGQTIAFATKQRLLPDGGLGQAYVWRHGELFVLPTGDTETRGTRPSVPAVSQSGAEVAFLTSLPLLPADGDVAADVYVARVDGGFPSPTPSTACNPLTNACQGPLSANPATPQGLSSTFMGPGNLTRKAPPTKKAVRVTVSRPKKVRGASARITVKVPERGKIRVSGSGLRRTYRTAKKAGTYRVAVKLSRRARRTLTRKHRTKVRVSVRFTPRQGGAQTRRVRITFKEQSKRRHRSAARASRRTQPSLSERQSSRS